MEAHKTCPWCEGRKIMGRLVVVEKGRSLTGAKLREVVLGDGPCRTCGGTGRVPPEVYLKWTRPAQAAT